MRTRNKDIRAKDDAEQQRRGSRRTTDVYVHEEDEFIEGRSITINIAEHTFDLSFIRYLSYLFTCRFHLPMMQQSQQWQNRSCPSLLSSRLID